MARRLALALLVVGVFSLPTAASPAPSADRSARAADVPCSVAKVTSDGTSFSGDRISASTDGTRLVFETGASSIAVLDTVADTTEILGNAREPSISGDGNYIAYRNAAREVYRRTFASSGTPDLISDDLTQSGDVGPSLSGNGSFMAFRSMGHPVTDDGAGIWRWRASGDQLLQVFDSDDDSAFVSTPVMTKDNQTVAFTSDANVNGTNPDHNLEAFRWSGSVAQVTVSALDNHMQDVSADGKIYAITSEADWAGGTNSDGNTELFLFDLNVLPPAIEQVTLTAFPATGSGPATTDDEGELTVFRSSRNVLGTGGPLPASQIFVYRQGVTRHQLTDVPATSPDSLSVPEISGDGSTVFVGSTRNFGGLNADHSSEVFALDCAIPSFSDVPITHAFYDEIEWLVASGITGGFPDGTFRPAASVTRQAMAAFLYRMAGSPVFTPPGSPTFSDVPVSHAFYDEIEWLSDSGIGGGFSDGTFRPTAQVSRQAMAAFLYRMAGSPVFTPPGSPSFSDVPADHPFFAEIEWLVDAGIAGGFPDGRFKPGANVSRQAMAAFLFRLDPLLP
jgi:Tol biopolymer transport system component